MDVSSSKKKKIMKYTMIISFVLVACNTIIMLDLQQDS